MHNAIDRQRDRKRYQYNSRFCCVLNWGATVQRYKLGMQLHPLLQRRTATASMYAYATAENCLLIK